MEGVLNINKPVGPTSFDIISRIRRLSSERKVGHAGTLDPAASGVLPVCIGRATRIIEYLVEGTKTYRAEIELGTATDTYDSEGKITGTGDVSDITREQIESALASFRGRTEQTPPRYSAVKHQGRPLYRWAREGAAVEVKSRPVTIHEIQLTAWQKPVLTAEITCGKGTYIRSLADDLGKKLGCGAYLKGLVRLRSGQFDIADSITMEQLEESFPDDGWEKFLHPIDSVLWHLREVVAGEEQAHDILNGRPVAFEGIAPEETLLRAHDETGRFLGILVREPEGAQWRPKKVFR